MKKLWFSIVICFLCLFSARAQSAEAPPSEKESDNSTNVGSEPQSFVFAKRDALPFKAKRTAAQRKRLLPDARDTAKYAAFLQKPKTGLIKIFFDIGCEENANVVRADAVCLNSIPNSAFYSFREKEHTNEYLADIRVKNNFFVADGFLTQGIMVSLGDVGLESLSLASEGLSFLVEFAPEANNKDALQQTNQIIKGIRSGKFIYKKTLPILENTTYALRVVAYRGKFLRVFRGNFYDVLAGDERADLILAFRVVRKSADGSVTLLWKELQRKQSPKIIFPKRKKSKK